jgi:hypothetical protein
MRRLTLLTQSLRFLFLVLAFLFPGVVLAQTPTLVQHVSGSNTRTFSLGSPYCYYQILPNATTAGNGVVVGFTFNGNLPPTVTDDKGDAYAVEENFYGAASGQTAALAASFGVAAGARRISVCFPSSPGPSGSYLAVVASEFSNVIAIDGSGTGANTTGTAVAAGSLTPSATDDLAYQIVFSTGLIQSGFTAGSQSNVSWNLLSADLKDGLGAQYGVYGSTSAINPTMSMGTSSTSVTAAILLKSGTAGGVPTGMRIVHLQHQGFCGVNTCGSAFSTPAKLQFPSTGNLIVALGGGGNPLCSISNVTDTQGNSWAQAGSTYTYNGGGFDTVQTYYAANATTASNLGLTMTFTNGNCDWDMQLYDVAGAAASPFDKANGATGNQTAEGGALTVPYTITPANSGELIFVNNVWDFNTASGLTSNIGSTCTAALPVACFDADIFSGEPISGPEPVDQNNGWGHAFSTSTAAITFTWVQLSATLSAGPWASMASAFEGGTIGQAPAPAVQLGATSR